MSRININNFFDFLSRPGNLAKKISEKDLVTFGKQDSKSFNNFSSKSIKYEDLEKQISDKVLSLIPSTPEPVDSAVNYSNVAFLDPINGNNTTGVINDFRKPFLTLGQALNAVNAIPGKSINNRGLVYVRRGQYINQGTLDLINNIDIYCEAGVVFTGNLRFITTSQVNCKFLGYAAFNVSFGSNSYGPIFNISQNSIIDIEFDYMICFQSAIGIDLRNAGAGVNKTTIKGNYINTNSGFSGNGITMRGIVNADLTLTDYITAPYKTIDCRNVGGLININIPKIILRAGNPYGGGGNFKQAVFINSSSATPGKVVINGDVVVEDTLNYGGITSAFRFWESPNTPVVLNGDVIGGVISAVTLSNGNGNLVMNGNIRSNLTCLAVQGGNKAYINNSVIIRDTEAVVSPFSISNTAELHISNSMYYSSFWGNMINMDSLSKLFLNHFVSEGIIPNPGEVLTFSGLSGGTGYVTATNVAVTGGTGTGLLLNIVANISGVITSVTVANPGQNYTIGDTLMISSGNNDATITVASLKVEGTFINTTASTTIGLNNVVTNRSYNNAITASYVINLTVEPNVKIPQFI